jgi:hypothetical protein
MSNESRFTNQKLDSKDYAAEEGRADAVKNGAALVTLLGTVVVVGRKLVPKIVKGIGKITKI